MAYLTINGKLLKVDGKYVTVESSGAIGEAQSKTVTPTKSSQTVTPDSGYSLSSVTVNAIPDEYVIQNLQVKRGIVPTKSVQGITYETPYNGLLTVFVNPIPDEYIIPSGTLDITANGSYDIKVYESVTVNVPEPKLEYRTVTPTKEGFKIYPSSGYDGISEVWVNPISSYYIEPTGDLSITENGTHNVREYSTVTVNVPTKAPYHLDDSGDLPQIYDIPLSGFNPISPVPKVGDYAINTDGYLYEVINIDSESGDYSLELVDASDRFYPELQDKEVTPTKSLQMILPDSGYGGLSEVTINAIPDEYITTSDATATAEDIASGKTAYVNGEKITGTATGSSSGSGSNATFSFDVATATLTITEG